MAKDKEFREITRSIAAYTGELRREVPAVMQGFGALSRAATAAQTFSSPAPGASASSAW